MAAARPSLSSTTVYSSPLVQVAMYLLVLGNYVVPQLYRILYTYNLHTTFLIGAEYENMIADLARSETEHTGMPAKRPFFGVLCSIK